MFFFLAYNQGVLWLNNEYELILNIMPLTWLSDFIHEMGYAVRNVVFIAIAIFMTITGLYKKLILGIVALILLAIIVWLVCLVGKFFIGWL